jgi:tripartite ATP-independent transporter DctM subunit
MRNHGYDDEFTFCITLASGTVGPIVPPSIPFVVYASFASISTGALFMGGIIPGVLMCIALAVMCFFISRKKNYPREEKTTLKEKIIAFKKSFLAMLMPVIIIGGIWTGWFTPTEAALVSNVYAVILTIFIYRETTFWGLLDTIKNSLANFLPLLLIVAGANLFSFIINFEKIDDKILNALTSITSNKYVVLLLINIVVLFMGMFFDTMVALFMLAPIMGPICNIYGISVIHIGVVIVFNMMIGRLTPPVGPSLYLVASINQIRVITLVKWILPWFVPLFITLLLITYIDWFVMFLPRLMGIGN